MLIIRFVVYRDLSVFISPAFCTRSPRYGTNTSITSLYATCKYPRLRVVVKKPMQLGLCGFVHFALNSVSKFVILLFFPIKIS